MNEPEVLDDTMESAGRIVEAMHIFSRASVRALELLGTVSAARQTIEKTMPAGKEALELENIETVLNILSDSKLSEIFKDPAAMAVASPFCRSGATGWSSSRTGKFLLGR